MYRKTFLALLLTVVAVLTTTTQPAMATTPTTNASTTSDVVVYLGQSGATAYTQTLDGVLSTETQILATEQQIADMADRIVYVTVVSQTGAIEVVYAALALVPLGPRGGSYLYRVLLAPVAALPAGW